MIFRFCDSASHRETLESSHSKQKLKHQPRGLVLHFWRRKRDMASVGSLGGVWHALVQSARYSHAIRQIPPKAVCEPCGFGRSSHDIKTNTIRKGWCPFLWRRKRDSNPRGFWPNGFQDRLVVTASIFLHIIMHAVAL